MEPPSGYTLYLNVAVTLLFLGQVYVWYVVGDDRVADGRAHVERTAGDDPQIYYRSLT